MGGTVKQFANTHLAVSHYPMLEVPEKTGQDLRARFDKTLSAQRPAEPPGTPHESPARSGTETHE